MGDFCQGFFKILMLRKFLQIADLHLGIGFSAGEDAGDLREREVRRRFCALVAHMERWHNDAVFCVCLGDIAHKGDAEAYAFFKREMATLSFPCRVLLGNHDEWETFSEAFPESIEGGFVQTAIEDEAGVFLLLDSVSRGEGGALQTHSEGGFGKARLAWLREKLALYAERDVFVVMHHPPCSLDAWECEGLRSAEAFHALLEQHGRVRHIFCGHYHRPLSGGWRGIGLSCLHSSVSHQTILPRAQEGAQERAQEGAQEGGERGRYRYCDEPMSYGVLWIDGERVLLHHVFYEGVEELGYAEGVIRRREKKP